MKKIMKKAWEIAKEAVIKFGGKAIQYISKALKIVWRESKKNQCKKGEIKYSTVFGAYLYTCESSPLKSGDKVSTPDGIFVAEEVSASEFYKALGAGTTYEEMSKNAKLVYPCRATFSGEIKMNKAAAKFLERTLAV